MPTVVAILTPRPGRLETLVSAYREAVADVHAEAGCVLYSAHVDDERMVMIEVWRTRADLDAHGAGRAVQRLRELRGDALASRELFILDEISVDGAPKSTLG